MSIRNRSKQILSLEHFQQNSHPEKIAPLDLTPPDFRQYILRMLVKQPYHELRLPLELEWVRKMIEVSSFNQEHVIGVRHPYLYITVRHGLVASESDDLWHVDGFSTKITHLPEQNYIWVDHTPTECAEIPMIFPTDFDPMVHNVHLFIQRRISGQPKILEPKTVYCMDPYVIHRRPKLVANTKRTFVRISYTPIMISDDNNTQNPLLPMPIFGFDGVKDFRNHLLDYDLCSNP
jgi:hypothetical protein